MKVVAFSLWFYGAERLGGRSQYYFHHLLIITESTNLLEGGAEL